MAGVRDGGGGTSVIAVEVVRSGPISGSLNVELTGFTDRWM